MGRDAYPDALYGNYSPGIQNPLWSHLAGVVDLENVGGDHGWAIDVQDRAGSGQGQPGGSQGQVGLPQVHLLAHGEGPEGWYWACRGCWLWECLWPGQKWPGPARGWPGPAQRWPGPARRWPGPALRWPGPFLPSLNHFCCFCLAFLLVFAFFAVFADFCVLDRPRVPLECNYSYIPCHRILFHWHPGCDRPLSDEFREAGGQFGPFSAKPD